ncbi:MAG: exodeoxyribonuclease VII small subunit [Prevotella sp.]
MTKAQKYEEAVQQLEEMVARMESDEIDVDTMAKQLAKAKQLIALCKAKLTKADDEIQKILAEK